jgi:protein tyrosine phosphatase (PTP) superfamily phosphohydrolase (DUF442 family)
MVHDAASSEPLPSVDAPRPQDYPGVHNAVAFHDGFVSGSAPEGDAGFDTLAAMGIQTIISVDGAIPDVARAEARDMRYIHLPIGYNGFDEARRLQLARASRDAMTDGPVYIHCHHGKHRSAGAAAAIAAALGWKTPEYGIARMEVSGTSPRYTGLYECAAESSPVSMHALAAVPADFPSIWTPSTFVGGMVEIGRTFEHLKLIEQAGWTTPQDHPDLVAVAEAGRLADLHRTLESTAYSSRQPSDFAGIMRDGYTAAQALETLLLAPELDHAALRSQMERISTSCDACHASYRDAARFAGRRNLQRP